MTAPNPEPLPVLGHGFYWQDLSVGQRFRTFRRTVTESDLVGFINTTGMLEAIFIEAGYEHGAIKGRPVPAALTYSLIEGFLLQSMIQGTGLAMLELHKNILGPVVVGVAAVILMVAVGKGAEKRILDRIRDMGTNLVAVSAGQGGLNAPRGLRFGGNGNLYVASMEQDRVLDPL